MTRPFPPDKTRTGNVLVLGTDTRVILAVARSLGRKGLRVHLGWCDPDSIATRSRYVAAFHQIPPYSPRSDAWKQALLELLRSQPFDLVIPCNDSTVVPIQSHRREFAECGNVYLLSTEAFDMAFSKPKTCDLAQSLGVPVPEGGTVQSCDEALAMFRRLAPPVVLKPHATVTLQSEGVSSVCRKIETEEQLLQWMALPPYSAEAQLQQHFAGTGVGIEMLVHEGEVLFAFQHVRIHETMEYGSSYRRSAAILPELLEDARKLMHALRYTGVAMAEFIVDFATGRRVFLEINGRFWGSLPLAVVSGADFPYYLYQMLVEGRREFPPQYRQGVYCRNLLLDWQARRRWLSGSLTRRGLLVAQNVFHILTRDQLDSFASDDWRPGLFELWQFCGRFLEKARAKLQTGPRAELTNERERERERGQAANGVRGESGRVRFWRNG